MGRTAGSRELQKADRVKEGGWKGGEEDGMPLRVYERVRAHLCVRRRTISRVLVLELAHGE